MFKIAIALKLKNFRFRLARTTLIGMRKGLDTFAEVKIDINLVNFDTLLSSMSLMKILLGGAKDEHFSCFHSSCQLEL